MCGGICMGAGLLLVALPCCVVAPWVYARLCSLVAVLPLVTLVGPVGPGGRRGLVGVVLGYVFRGLRPLVLVVPLPPLFFWA